MSYLHFQKPSPGPYIIGREFVQETHNVVGFDSEKDDFVLCSRGYTLVRNFVPITYPEIRCATDIEAPSLASRSPKHVSRRNRKSGRGNVLATKHFPPLPVHQQHTTNSNCSNALISDNDVMLTSHDGLRADVSSHTVYPHFHFADSIDRRFLSIVIMSCVSVAFVLIASVCYLMWLCSRRRKKASSNEEFDSASWPDTDNNTDAFGAVLRLAQHPISGIRHAASQGFESRSDTEIVSALLDNIKRPDPGDLYVTGSCDFEDLTVALGGSFERGKRDDMDDIRTIEPWRLNDPNDLQLCMSEPRGESSRSSDSTITASTVRFSTPHSSTEAQSPGISIECSFESRTDTGVGWPGGSRSNSPHAGTHEFDDTEQEDSESTLSTNSINNETHISDDCSGSANTTDICYDPADLPTTPLSYNKGKSPALLPTTSYSESIHHILLTAGPVVVFTQTIEPCSRPEPSAKPTLAKLATLQAQENDTETSERSPLHGHRTRPETQAILPATQPTHPCPHCLTPLPTPGKLRDHINRKHNRRFPCIICAEAFHLRVDLKRHQQTVHEERFPGAGMFLCGKGCGKGFRRRDHALRHGRGCV
ncbi:hypothetical protein CC86DRAFT_470741 [Ophiobolus disseminans]|uniref:C2H2-type domain-containing protein n=1 Tax=Ophiobolus disseminans TaxID=1469910 RepID=A0A6A6ZKD9_9PLEO|nr:hypothetical protein CC86DRAFT_470741 [Ophiobolus disseminans]